MRHTLIYFLLIFLGACSMLKKSPTEPVSQDRYGLLFSLVIEHSAPQIIKQYGIQAVQIYDFQYRQSGKIKDSMLIEYRDIDYYDQLPRHTLYEILYDSLGRYDKRYATRVESGQRHLNDYYVYGEDSLLKEWIVLNSDGKVNSKEFFFYNSQKQLIKKEKRRGYSIYPAPVLEQKIHYEYRKLEAIADFQYLEKSIEYSFTLQEKSPNSKLTKVFNAKGQEISYQVESLAEGKVTYSWGTTSSYGKQGKLIKENFSNSEGKEHETIYSYNPKGLLSELYRHKKNDKKPIEHTKFYYTRERSDWKQKDPLNY